MIRGLILLLFPGCMNNNNVFIWLFVCRLSVINQFGGGQFRQLDAVKWLKYKIDLNK
tara:strand:+ start:204 stop:374 length:171 start_codon:yes stop_codon:yes gene_type:complete